MQLLRHLDARLRNLEVAGLASCCDLRVELMTGNGLSIDHFFLIFFLGKNLLRIDHCGIFEHLLTVLSSECRKILHQFFLKCVAIDFLSSQVLRFILQEINDAILFRHCLALKMIAIVILLLRYEMDAHFVNLIFFRECAFRRSEVILVGLIELTPAEYLGHWWLFVAKVLGFTINAILERRVDHMVDIDNFIVEGFLVFVILGDSGVFLTGRLIATQYLVLNLRLGQVRIALIEGNISFEAFA